MIETVQGLTASYVIDLEKVTCDCQHFKFRCSKFAPLDPRRLCKHLKALEDKITYKEKESKSRKGKHPREKMIALKEKLDEIFEYFPVSDVEYCGSFRRGKAFSGDMDVLICWKDYDYAWKDKKNFIDWIRSISSEIIIEGEKKFSSVIDGIQTDIRFIEKGVWPFALMHTTGSTEENVRLRAIAKRKGMMLNESGLFQGDSSVICETERDVYEALGEQFKAPEDR